ncbi:unnamed protein product [Ilex paraguariensis]|uniref:Secreted protein n=1 Tax=Ilex paraguariensis TaxID=185542 RepID=A0ABC8R7Y2_9AQUA
MPLFCFLSAGLGAFIIAAATADFPAGLLPAGFFAGFQLVLSLFTPFSCWFSAGLPAGFIVSPAGLLADFSADFHAFAPFSSSFGPWACVEDFLLNV